MKLVNTMEMKPLKKLIGVGVNVGLYDQIMVCMRCPKCGHYETFDAQTKDLGCRMYNYHAIDESFYQRERSQILGKKFRNRIPVFKKFPKDKSAKVWKNQTELIKAEATVPKEFSKLKYVSVIADCHSESCQLFADLMMGYHSGFGRSFEGKIKIRNGELIGEIYDIEK